MKVRIFETMAEAAEGTLEYLQGPRIAVSGGKTFSDLFPLWVPAVKQSLDSGHELKFYPVDERQVPFEDAESNWRVCHEKLLVPAGLGTQQKHHAVSAAQYSALLKQEFGGSPVIFDSVFLGTGEDGHTASLFPGGAALHDHVSVVLDVVGPKPPPRRVTLAFKPLWECKLLVAVIFGASKASIVQRVRARDMSLPITQALAGHSHAVLILDRAAAGS